VTVFFFKIVGKRQVGELQLSELVVAIFASELATAPITDKSISILKGIIPVFFLLSIEVGISFLSIKLPFFKKAFDSSPDMLIEKGKLNQKALTKARLTVEELLSVLRLQGASNISDVNYAVLEGNGKISVVLKSDGTSGISRGVIVDGKVNGMCLKKMGKNEKWLEKFLKEQGVESSKDVFLMTIDDDNNIWYEKKEKN
jgi:uncharacterized membrane protein YcaP (DUF421 family)